MLSTGMFYCISRLLSQPRFGPVRRRMRQILHDFFSSSRTGDGDAEHQQSLIHVRWALLASFALLVASLVIKLDGTTLFASTPSSSSVVTRRELLHETFLIVTPSIEHVPVDGQCTRDVCLILLYCHHPLLGMSLSLSSIFSERG